MKKLGLIILICLTTSCSTQTHYHPSDVDFEQSSESTQGLYTRARLRKQENVQPVSKTPDENSSKLKEYKNNWLYGHGLGKTLTNVGMVAIFPPYAIYVLGNAGTQLLGYEPYYVSDALPESTRKPVLKAYNGVTSVPGRISAGIAGEEFREIDEEEK